MCTIKNTCLSLLVLFGVVFSSLAQWHEPKAVTGKFYPDPDVVMDIPVFQKKRGFTSYREMLGFIETQEKEHTSLMKVEMVGKTQKGRDIPLVSIRKQPEAGKLNIFYFARVHGDEPAGTEAMLYFIRQLLSDPSMSHLLDKLNFYILPMLNVDGGESFSRRTANGIDMNRDQSKLETPEAQLLHSLANRINPHVSVDFHEFQPVRTDFLKISSTQVLATPWDVMLLYSGNPNVPVALRNTVDNLFLPDIYKTLDSKGLTHHTYYSSRNQFGEISIPVGGASPRSTSNAMALKGIVSLLVETRGINLGRTSLKRRVYGAYLSALSVAETAFTKEKEVLKAIREAGEDRTDIAVRFKSTKVPDYEFPFLSITENKLVRIKVDASFSTQSVATKTRPLPEAYYILPSQEKAVRVLENMGVKLTVLPKPETRELEAYTVLSAVESGSSIGGVYPLSVKVRVEKKRVELPAGTFRVDSRQKNIRAATVVLEPESSNGFVNYRVISLAAGDEVPVYRELSH